MVRIVPVMPNFRLFGLVFTLLLWVNYTIAGGYQVNLQGIKQTGMGHTGVSLYQDASNLFFNPGSMSYGQSKIAVALGLNAVDARLIHYNPTVNKEFRNIPSLGTPFSLYYTHQLGKGFSAGLGIYTPFGSSLEYPEAWVGRYVLTDISLGTVYAQPTISYRYGPFGIGIGLMLGTGWLNYAQDLPISDNEGNTASVRLDAKSQAIGINIGAFVELQKDFIFGASYRSAHRYDVRDGYADFTVPQSAQEQLQDQTFSAGLWVPANAMFGLSYKPNAKLRFSGEINFTFWSVYDRLMIDFHKNSEVLQDVNEPREWRDSDAFRFGIEYQFKEWFIYRLGFSKDNTPVNRRYYGPETPDSDRRGYHTGASFRIKKKLAIDLAFQWVEPEQIEAIHEPSGFGGIYKGRAFVYSGGLSYEF